MFSAIVCSCVLTLSSIPAESTSVAKPVIAGIPIMITRGDTITKIGDLPAALKAAAPPNLAVGYKYSYFGVFWLDFWTWGGEYCLFEGKGFEPLTREVCAKLLNTEAGRLPTPLFYRFPLGLVILGGLMAILIPMGIVNSAREKKEKARIQALFEDSRYQAAFEIFNQNLPREPEPQTVEPGTQLLGDDAVPPTSQAPERSAEEQGRQVEDAIRAAVDHLVHNGEDREIADANFRLMLAIVAQSQDNTAA